MTFAPQPKPRPALLDKRDKASAKDAIDRRERAKVRARSGGRCEVQTVAGVGVLNPGRESIWTRYQTTRCTRRASEDHHLKGGFGRRNIGPSILARHRLDCCHECHKEITNHVLRPIGEDREDALVVRYERAR